MAQVEAVVAQKSRAIARVADADRAGVLGRVEGEDERESHDDEAECLTHEASPFLTKRAWVRHTSTHKALKLGSGHIIARIITHVN